MSHILISYDFSAVAESSTVRAPREVSWIIISLTFLLFIKYDKATLDEQVVFSATWIIFYAGRKI